MKKVVDEDTKQKIEKMFSNLDYINWLVSFTNINPIISDDYYRFFKNKLAKNDHKNVDKLSLLYYGIESYATMNHIYPFYDKETITYKIKINDVGFEIGVLVGKGAIFFCNRVTILNENEFLDFNDIVNHKKLVEAERIDEKLNLLFESIMKAYENGVPFRSIADTLYNALAKIKENEQSKLVLMRK